MKCHGVLELLIEYADGDLCREDHEAVRDHLLKCDSCAQELTEIENLKKLLADDGYVEPDSFYWTRFNAALRRRREQSGIMAGIFAGGGRWGEAVPRLATVTVAALCFIVGLWVGIGPTNEGAVVDSGQPMFGEHAQFAGGPLVSSRSKHLVESGIEHEPFAFAADTLSPESFQPVTEEPRMYLATSERQAAMERRLGQANLRD
jgi:anti-sigma factor RsiW